MTVLITTLCERLAKGIELDPTVLAARLGRVDEPGHDGLPIRVVPSNASFSAANVFADESSGQTSMVILVPAARLTLAALKESLGSCQESRRLHPHDPRKFIFSASNETSRPYTVDVVAYVS